MQPRHDAVEHQGTLLLGTLGDGHESAASVSCPVHLVAGSLDLMTPSRGARALAAVLTEAGSEVRVTELSGSGHMLLSERPEETLAAILSGLAASRPG